MNAISEQKTEDRNANFILYKRLNKIESHICEKERDVNAVDRVYMREEDRFGKKLDHKWRMERRE